MTPVLDAVHREELRKLAEAATPGPWSIKHRGDDRYILGHPSWPCTYNGRPGVWEVAKLDDLNMEHDGEVAANAAYIAAMSPDTTLALLAYIAELEAGLRGARERFAQIECKVIDGMLVTTPSKMIEWQKAIASHGFNETSALLPKASVREERG